MRQISHEILSSFLPQYQPSAPTLKEGEATAGLKVMGLRLSIGAGSAKPGRNEKLEAHLKVFRDLVEVVFELVGGRWPIERGVVANGAEEWLSVIEILAVLALACERLLLYCLR